MRAVNLLPVDSRAGRRRPPTAALAVAGLGVIAASALAVAYVSASGKVNERERELSAVESQLAAARRSAKPAKPVQPTQDAERQQRLTALNEALSKQLAWDRILRNVSLVLPDDVWFSSLGAGEGSAASTSGSSSSSSSSSTTSTTPTAGQTVTFSGFTYSQEGVARLLSRLALVPEFSNVKLQKSSATEVGSQQIFSFTVAAEIGGGTP